MCTAHNSGELHVFKTPRSNAMLPPGSESTHGESFGMVSAGQVQRQCGLKGLQAREWRGPEPLHMGRLCQTWLLLRVRVLCGRLVCQPCGAGLGAVPLTRPQ